MRKEPWGLLARSPHTPKNLFKKSSKVLWFFLSRKNGKPTAKNAPKGVFLFRVSILMLLLSSNIYPTEEKGIKLTEEAARDTLIIAL